MKYLLTGVAMAAALAIAAPAWAQNAPMTPGGSKAAPSAPAKSTPTAAKPMAKKPMHHMAHKRMMSSGDAMTEQLNQQELQRIQGGMAPSAPPAPPPAPRSPGGNNPTSGAAAPTAGIGAPPPK